MARSVVSQLLLGLVQLLSDQASPTPPSLFGQVYGYWEPPTGWQRGRNETRFLELKHAEQGTLEMEQPQGFDNVPVVVHWHYGAQRTVSASELSRAFLPDGWEITKLTERKHEATWFMQRKSFLGF